MTRSLAIVLAAATCLSACAAAHHAPPPLATPAPPAWTQAGGSAGAPAPAVADAWWRAFDDAILTDLAARAGETDDVALAATRLDQARAALEGAQAALRPQISESLDASSRQSGDGPERADKASLALSLNFNPDLSGAVRMRRGAAAERLAAAGLDVRAVRIESRAAAARLYLAVRDAQAQQRSARAVIEVLDATVKIAKARRLGGLASDLEVQAALAAQADALAAPARFQGAEAEARLGLERLLGLAPGALKTRLAGEVQTPLARPIALAAPVEVLGGRPDVAAAERRLAAAGFDARAARADFWPNLDLSAAFGVQALSPETPFEAGGGLWRLGAGLAAPLFSFGRLEGARDLADARRAEAAVAYRQSASRAVEEVEIALARGASSSARLQARSAALQSWTNRAHLARARYGAGLSPLLEVLTAEQGVHDARSQSDSARAEAALAYVDLAAALGLGGDPGPQGPDRENTDPAQSPAGRAGAGSASAWR